MGDPSIVCKSMGGTAGQQNSCVLSPPDENAKLKDWDYVLNFRPRAVKDRIRQRFPDMPAPGYHPIENGRGPLNLDFYPVQILKLPSIAGTTLSPDAFLAFVRRNLHDFLDQSNSDFEPYDVFTDDSVWRSDSPLGAVMHFKIQLRLAPELNPKVADAGVIAAEHAPDHWIFSTLRTPSGGNHPVSGNRQFGYTVLRAGTQLSEVYQKAGVTIDNKNGDALYFYTRGADRCTNLDDYIVSGMNNSVFAGAHALWLSLQQRIVAWITQQGGVAFIPGYMSERYDWDAIRRTGPFGLWNEPSQ